MTVSITVPGATFTKHAAKVLLPYIDEAKAFYLYGQNFALSSVNHALNPESAVATAIGSPTYGAGYAVAGLTSGFDLGYINNYPFTYIAIADLDASAGAAIMGTWPSTVKSMLFTPGGTTLSNTINGVVRASKASVPNDGFTMYGASFSGNRASVFYHNGTTLDLVSNAYTDSVQPSGNLLVGAQSSASYGANFKIASVVAYERELSSAEILEVYTYLKGLLATRSVSVL